MTAIPAKLFDAFEKIRLGKVDEGVRMFDRIEGFDAYKAIPLTELSYFRHDWKRGLMFTRDFLESDIEWLKEFRFFDSSLVLHLEMIVVATFYADCWKESRDFLKNLKKLEDNKDNKIGVSYLDKAISLVSDPANTINNLTESKPKIRTNAKKSLEELERDISRKKITYRNRWHIQRENIYDHFVKQAYDKATTEDHIALYTNHLELFDHAVSHLHAAISFLALNCLKEAKNAIRKYMKCWVFKEPYQVAPINLFTEPVLFPIMSDRRFTESLLTIPHHRIKGKYWV
ncbi:MAG: hypothetical protein LBL39_06190 [Planctomycetaceae bacterium]|jgi:hypothetical protein|nr:hypothetical protein [Planctomycetaceae bacterium]